MKQNQTSKLQFDFKLILIINDLIILHWLLMSTQDLYTHLDKQYVFVSVTDYNIKTLNSKLSVLFLIYLYLFPYIILD